MSINLNHRFRLLSNNTGWKSENDSAYKNANVPVNVFSGQSSGVFVPGRPHPIKNTYRRSLNFAGNHSSTRGTTIKDAMDAPGGAIVSAIDCNMCSNNNVLQYNGKTTNMTQTPSAPNQCITAERNARLRLRHKTVIPIAAGCDNKCTNKPYFTRLEERRKYLKQDFKSNLSNDVCCNRDPACHICSISNKNRALNKVDNDFNSNLVACECCNGDPSCHICSISNKTRRAR